MVDFILQLFLKVLIAVFRSLKNDWNRKRVSSSMEWQLKGRGSVPWQNKLLLRNWVYYWIYKYKTHKCYNYLQKQLKLKILTIVIKNAKQKACVWRPSGLIKMGEEVKALLMI